MVDNGFKRKLTAIMSADVKEYSRLMRDDEEATIRTLTAYRKIMAGFISQYRGRVVDSPGDNLLAEFASVVDAVKCAVKIQRKLAERNTDLPPERKMEFRIGVNLGDVVEEGDRIYGDGVNIAARVEGICEGGGICISGTAFEHVENKLDLAFEDLGEHEVKNISKPVRVFRVRSHPEAATHRVIKADKVAARTWRKRLAVIAGIVIIGVAAAVWQFYGRISVPSVEVASMEKMAFPLPDKPSIAVLPFVNMSDDPQQEYFSDGITEDIITDLSAISQLFVTARNSTFVYKDKPVKIRQVAEELGVRYVLEGSVRKAGNKVRINAQLIDATSGHHLWAKRYDGELIDIFALQDKISQRIVSALKVELTAAEQKQAVHQETGTIEAYDAFLQGWNYYRRNTPQDWDKAISHFKKAVEFDPQYSRAYAATALIYWRYARTSRPFFQDSELRLNYEESCARAREYLQSAKKKPTSIYYQVEASMSLYRRQYAKAIDDAEHAIGLDPNDVDGILTMASILMAVGKIDRAVELIDQGMRLDPHNIARPLYLLGMAHFARGQMGKSVSMIERALTHNPDLPRPAPILPAALAHLGQEQKSQAALADFKKATIHYNFLSIMFNFPFQDPQVLDRLASGIRKAGMWATDYQFYKLLPENMLDENEIRELIFGRKVAGNWQTMTTGSSFLVERGAGGKAAWYVPPNTIGDYNDNGRSWIEDGMLCDHWQMHFMGLKHCMSIFRNPEGARESKNQYIAVSDFNFQPFSPID